jgi:hypothetical protein
MKLLSPLLLAAALALPTAALARDPATLAHELTMVAFDQEMPDTDPRVAETRKLLDRAVKQTGETPFAVSSACQRFVGHLRDAAQIRATPLELLAVLGTHGKAGVPLNDTLQAYVAARKAAPGRSHDEAMAGLSRRR